jgi:hypothetical protein
MARRKADGRKWNLCLLVILFLGNTIIQALMTIFVLGVLGVSILVEKPGTDRTPTVVAMLVLGIICL